MNFQPETEALLRQLIFVAELLLIPVGVALLIVLFKVAFLLHSVSDLVKLAAREIEPLVIEARAIISNLSSISNHASGGVDAIGNALLQTKPAIERGVNKLINKTQELASAAGRLVFQ